MPIRKELRAFYGAEWNTVVRPRIIKRAGGRFTRSGRYLGGACCEQCGKPDRKHVFTFSGRTVFSAKDVRPFMFWIAERGASDNAWRDQFGKPFPTLRLKGLPRKIWVVLQVAHLNHVAGDDRDENMKAYCAWCHLNYDQNSHKKTRCERKDAGRPLLAEAGAAL